jgi:hypothetical protein
MRAHVGAIGVEHHDFAALAAIEHHVLSEIVNIEWFAPDLSAFRDREPSARKIIFAKPIFSRLRHGGLPHDAFSSVGTAL